jgi:hypothetical protein
MRDSALYMQPTVLQAKVHEEKSSFPHAGFTPYGRSLLEKSTLEAKNGVPQIGGFRSDPAGKFRGNTLVITLCLSPSEHQPLEDSIQMLKGNQVHIYFEE